MPWEMQWPYEVNLYGIDTKRSQAIARAHPPTQPTQQIHEITQRIHVIGLSSLDLKTFVGIYGTKCNVSKRAANGPFIVWSSSSFRLHKKKIAVYLGSIKQMLEYKQHNEIITMISGRLADCVPIG